MTKNRYSPNNLYMILISLSLIIIFLSISSGCSLNASNTTYKPESQTQTEEDSSIQIPTSILPNMMSPTPKRATATKAITKIEPLSAKLSEVLGDVQAQRPDESNYSKVANNMILEEKSNVKTMDNSKVKLEISNKTIVRLGPNTLFNLVGQEEKPEGLITKLKIEFGKIWAILGKGSLEVSTPSGVAAVRGSYLSVNIDSKTGQISITCLEGNCSLQNGAGIVNIIAGQTAFISNASTPPQTGRMTDADIREWLSMNPEATLVILQVTATVKNLPPVTNTPIATRVPGGTIR